MNVALVGTRGIPGNYGGFETFAEEISPRLNSDSSKITVYCEKRESNVSIFNGVALEYSKYRKAENPLLFYCESIYRASKKSNVLIVAGTGGSVFYFIPKLFGCKIVTNIDGVESKRTKWSLVKRLYVKLSEFVAILTSDMIIADSIGIKEYVLANYSINENRIRVIEYGAYLNNKNDDAVLNKYQLTSNDYYLVVSRLEPENNIKMIIEGYLASTSNKPLIIVGNLINNDYVNELLSWQGERVRFLGGIYNKDELNVVRHNCYSYIHGHSVGGTNPSLLEALGSGNVAICHDNIFNREVTSSKMFYFAKYRELTEVINNFDKLERSEIDNLKKIARSRIETHYNWENIASGYQRLLNEFKKQEQ